MRGYEPELCKPYSANQQMAVPPQKAFFEWRENGSAERSAQVVSRFPGFTSFLVRTWRKNSLGMARVSRFGSSSRYPSNIAGPPVMAKFTGNIEQSRNE